MSLPEVKLWTVLRMRPGGFKFRRQHPLGPYVLDFYCSSARLAIEVDGEAHGMGANPQRDVRRDKWFADQLIQTLRVPARQVLEDVEAVVHLIVGGCEARSQPEA